MSAERVDKGWGKVGLGGYSTAAIIGTLTHYGTPVDEAGFKRLSEERYPLAIGAQWQQGWKGTGQFKGFPFVAAEELWKRLAADKLAPVEVSRALGELVVALTRMLTGAADAPVGPAFAKIEALKPRLPLHEGKVPEAFSEESLQYLGEEGIKAFDELAEQLAKEGHTEDADQFVAFEELLLPHRAGVSRAIVRAAKGEKEAAFADLGTVVDDAKRPMMDRIGGLDGLIYLDAPEARTRAEAMLDLAEKENDYHVALGLAGRLAHLYEKARDLTAMRALQDRAQKLAAAHDLAHPDHVHHH